MNIPNLTREKVREILRASEGINTQRARSKARISSEGRLDVGRMAHPIGEHLRSADPLADTKGNTMFLSMEDMVEALWHVLNSGEGTSKLKKLKTGDRDVIKVTAGRLFPFECEVPDPQNRPITHRVKFSVAELTKAGWSATNCIAIVEARARGSEQHLQIHTFYPKYTAPELQRIFESVRAES